MEQPTNPNVASNDPQGSRTPRRKTSLNELVNTHNNYRDKYYPTIPGNYGSIMQP